MLFRSLTAVILEPDPSLTRHYPVGPPAAEEPEQGCELNDHEEDGEQQLEEQVRPIKDVRHRRIVIRHEPQEERCAEDQHHQQQEEEEKEIRDEAQRARKEEVK